jgi:DNA-binding response OmpR family regulator
MADRVLVVDDDLSLREFLKILLERDGHDVETAASGGPRFEPPRSAGRRWCSPI